MEIVREGLSVERRGPALWVTLDRPERLNALVPAMVGGLLEIIGEVAADEGVRVLVLRGAGRGFCAGLDTSVFSSSRIEASTASGLGGDLVDLVVGLHELPQPVVALVHGAAAGGGMAIALAADVRLAGRSAKFNAAFVNLGVTGCELGTSYFLPRIVGSSVANELLLTGRFLHAERAHQLGLVSELVDDDQLEAAGQALVTDLVRVAPLAVRRGKQTINSLAGVTDLRAAIDIEMAGQAACMASPDSAEAIRAFIDRRPPRWLSEPVADAAPLDVPSA